MGFNMRLIAIVQARMSSERLPGKVLMPFVGKPVLSHIVERLSYCKRIDQIIVATSDQESDNPIHDFCDLNNINCYRGNLNDVLDRYYCAAKAYKADAVLRITGDCPVIDPVIVDAVITGFMCGEFDCYGLGGDFPDGLDCTVYSFSAIENAWRNAELNSEREHVGPYIENNPQLFKNGSLKIFKGLSNHRWTLDEKNDYELLENIFNALYSDEAPFLSSDILDYLKSNPKISKINSHILRNEGYIESLKKDKI